jgi:hypothetical protein
MTRKPIWILTIAALAVVGCSSGNRPFQQDQRRGINGEIIYPSAPGGTRLAAALNLGSTCNTTGYLSPFSGSGFQNPMQPNPGQQSFNQAGQVQSPDFGGSLGVQGGNVQLLTVFENGPFVGAPGSPVGAGGNTYIGGAVSGIPTGRPVFLKYLSHESQIAFSADGTNLFVTLPDANQIAWFPVFDGGALGSAGFLPTSSHPTEITTAKGSDGITYVITTTREGLSIATVDRVDVRTGTGVPSALRERVRVDLGEPTAVAVSPGGNWVVIGTNPSHGRRNFGSGGRVYVCELALWTHQISDTYQTLGREELGRACPTEDPAYFSGRGNGPPNPFESGRQGVPGIPRKLAVSTSGIATLTNPMGPFLLRVPNIDEFSGGDDRLYGYLNQHGWAQTNGNMRSRNYSDLAFHPRSGNLIVSEGGRVITYALDNYNEMRTRLTFVDEIRLGGKISALAMDPGRDPELFLIADEGAGRVWVSHLDALSIRPPDRRTDFVQMTNGCPVDVAIRPRM